MPQGKVIDLRERQLLVRLKEHFDEERFRGPSVSTMDPAGRVAEALGLSKCAVKEIVSDYRRTGEVGSLDLASRGKPTYRIQSALETVIRQEIRRRNREGSHVSLGNLSSWLDEHYERIPTATLGRALKRMGFVFGTSRRKSALRERDDVLIARRTYLRAKLANGDSRGGTIRPEVYLDESYVNVNHSSERTWYFAEEGPWVRKPSGKGPRLILVHAITAAGWVEGAKLVFQARKRTGDYHGQMNFENFHKWFVESLLPRIPANSLIVEKGCNREAVTLHSPGSRSAPWVGHTHTPGHPERVPHGGGTSRPCVTHGMKRMPNNDFDDGPRASPPDRVISSAWSAETRETRLPGRPWSFAGRRL